MSDPKPAAGAAAKVASGGIDVKGISKVAIWITLIFFVAAFAVIIVVVNPNTVQNFIYFLQGLQVFFGLVIVFCLYKLQDYRKKFLATCHEIDHLFADKNGQGHHDHSHDDTHSKDGQDSHSHKVNGIEKFLSKNPIDIWEERYQRAVKSVGSNHREEWRLGLIELDKLLKDLLLKKGFNGETMQELLQDAKGQNFPHVDDALMANRTKKLLTSNMSRLPEEKDKNIYKNVATLYKLIINQLLS